MLSKVLSSGVHGVDAYTVEVETHMEGNRSNIREIWDYIANHNLYKLMNWNNCQNERLVHSNEGLKQVYASNKNLNHYHKFQLKSNCSK